MHQQFQRKPTLRSECLQLKNILWNLIIAMMRREYFVLIHPMSKVYIITLNISRVHTNLLEEKVELKCEILGLRGEMKKVVLK